MSSSQLISPDAASDEAKREHLSSVIDSSKKATIQSMPNKDKLAYNAIYSRRNKVMYSTLQSDSELSGPGKKLKKEKSAKSIREKAKHVATSTMESEGTIDPRKLVFDDQPPAIIGSPDQDKRPASPTLAETLLNHSLGCSGDSPMPTNLGQEEQVEIVTDLLKQKVHWQGKLLAMRSRRAPRQREHPVFGTEIHPQKVEGGGNETVSSRRKRGRLPKILVGEIGQYDASGEEKVDEVTDAQIVSTEADLSIGQYDASEKEIVDEVTEAQIVSKEADLSIWKYDASGEEKVDEVTEAQIVSKEADLFIGQYDASGEEKIDEVTKAQIVSKEADLSIGGVSINILEEHSSWIEQCYAPSNSSGALPDNLPVSQSKGAITWTTDQCTEAREDWQCLSCTTVPTCDDLLVENQSLPFVKSSPIWEMIESQKIFHLLPQKPHFRPLVQSDEQLCEGLAIGYMVAFASLVQNTSKLRLDSSRSAFEKILNSLVGFENYGFNVQPVREWVNELLKIKDSQGKLVDKLKGIEIEINKCKEFDDTCEKINKIEESHCLSRKKRELIMGQKETNETSIATLQMQVDRINIDIQSTNGSFDAWSKLFGE